MATLKKEYEAVNAKHAELVAAIGELETEHAHVRRRRQELPDEIETVRDLLRQVETERGRLRRAIEVEEQAATEGEQ